MHRERSFQAWVQVSMGCNSVCSYCIVPAVRGREQSRRPGEIVAEVTRLAARGRQGDDAARPERQLVGPRPAARDPHRVRRAAPRLRRRRRDRADPVHEPASEGLPRAGDRGDRRVRRGLRARAPAAPVGLVADAEGDAPHLHARALPRARRRACAPRSPTSRSAPTSSSASRARPRTTSAQTLEVVEEVGYDSAFTFVYSPRARHRGGRDARPGPARGEDRAHGAPRRACPARSRASGTRRASAASRRCSSRALAHRPDAAARPHAAQHDGQLHAATRRRASSSTC